MTDKERKIITDLIILALEEDIGDGDHTSLATISQNAKGKVELIAKDEGIIAGVKVAAMVFKEVDDKLNIEVRIKDGTSVIPGDIVMIIEGSSRSLLSAERTALNFIQRMSGIATFTNRVNSQIGDLDTKLLDTRKTTPYNRTVEKLAVRIGGGTNHRFGLFDMIMIKDNHVDFAGGISNAINLTVRYLKDKGKNLKIEIEVRDYNELNEVLENGAVNRIMLDNFSPEELRQAVTLINGRFETEASGGITIDNIRQYAETGVDFISVGALTHQISSLDLSLKTIKN
ncbi:MAG TPA: carboxylating nicotinate-nucleotide diphosphorylase [Bacteroidales bacterium]|jgi:nicotinate-nucleotide pyrophosphorylase (carboxylating)|nr:nicotinate-nucleotide diphosphorylase (carboxylating) [Bacteroidota bacterium]HJN05957.1 carboxylating nicotinate-nucleotide diphosphorylase [Bacteroidales bacterium]|tara:strand:- start:1116 stop:1973 length:858 start_codon:yes stop_codon:yes gene_type:complete